MPLYPLRFEPLFKSMLWGGDRLPGFLNRPWPSGDPVGEAWLLSDVDGHESRVADGPLAGRTLRSLLADGSARILGDAPAPNGRFPLLLKLIDARRELSVQVHPNDAQASRAVPGSSGKTEAWVVLDADPTTSRIYSGFAPGTTAEGFRTALAAGTVPRTLHDFVPSPGDCVFLPAGTVHAIGANLLIFEVQQTSDTTYRLYDWDRVDEKTGKPRALHVEEGLASSDFSAGPVDPVRPAVEVGGAERREGLVACDYFTLERRTAAAPFRVGAKGQCRTIVCVSGRGELEWGDGRFPFRVGDAYLLPADVGACTAVPHDGAIALLECGLPC